MKNDQTEKRENVNNGERLNLRLSPEEKNILKEMAAESNVSVTTLVKQMIFSNTNRKIYSKHVAQSLHHITDIMLNQVELYCNNQDFIHECERSAHELWHYLK